MLPFFTTKQLSDVTVVSFQTPSLMNAIDLERIGQALIAIVDEGARHVIVDFKRVTYLSSQALGVLLSLNGRLKKEPGGRLALCGANDSLTDLLKITRLNKVLHVVTDREQAIEWMKS